MLGSATLASTLAMIAAMLLQNHAEWRAGGPIPPDTGIARRVLPEITTTSRLLALVLISLIVVVICVLALLLGVGWPIVAVASALTANAISQVLWSLWARALQPGTLAGLFVMLPTSMWALLVTESELGWSPMVAGPMLSFPVLIGTWWLAHWLARHRRVRGLAAR